MMNNMESSKKVVWYRQWWRRLRSEMRWLAPGLGVKRWLLLILAGTTLLGIGLAMLGLQVLRTTPDGTWLNDAISMASLRFVGRIFRVLIFGTLGFVLVLVGTWGLSRSLLRPFLHPGRPVIDAVAEYRRRERGPRVVTIGGGHGLSALLRGLKQHTHNITAIVTVADDGGSSGELRRSMGILPPGDIRNCLAALSNDETLMTQIFQYRFGSAAGLNGHTLGNLFISALSDITGSFEEAVAESARVLAVHGQVLPATLHDVQLAADVQLAGNGGRVRVNGESKIPEAMGRVKRVWLDPDTPPAFPPTIAAILSADIIVVGPGSLYTSLLPNLLVPDIAEAIRASRAVKFFVCNVATQPGETDHFSCADHLDTIEKHTRDRLFDVVVCNGRFEGRLKPGVEWVKDEPTLATRYPVYQADLVDVQNPWRHDSSKLAQVIMDLFYERTGPLGG